METKTVFSRGNHFVEVESCSVIMKGVVKNFHIIGTEKYFVRQKTANLAANEILMQKCLSNDDYRERQALKSRIRNASKVINVFNCLQETKTYVKRWEGVIYLETKKKLMAELELKLSQICKKYNFRNVEHALTFTTGNNKIQIVKR